MWYTFAQVMFALPTWSEQSLMVDSDPFNLQSIRIRQEHKQQIKLSITLRNCI